MRNLTIAVCATLLVAMAAVVQAESEQPDIPVVYDRSVVF